MYQHSCQRVQRHRALAMHARAHVAVGMQAGVSVRPPQVLAFDFDALTLRLGGWKTSFPLKAKLDPR